MKKQLLQISLYVFGAMIIIFAIISDFLRGRAFMLGYAQTGLIMIGVGFVVYGYFSRKNKLTSLLFQGSEIIMNFYQKKQPWISRNELLISILVIVLIGLIAFVPSIKGAGFYSDDYHMIYGAYTSGAEKIQESYQIDRPVAGYTLQFLYQLFGPQIHYYQALVITLNILTALCALWIIRVLWPQQKTLGFTVAVLAVVYPGFIEHMNSFNFSLMLMSVFFYIFSVALTLKIILIKNSYVKNGLTLIAALFAIWSVLLNEYYLGLEVLRIGAIYLIGSGKSEISQNKNRILLMTFITYLPYFCSSVGFFIWRFSFFSNQRSATDLGSFIKAFLASPLYESATIIKGLFNNLINITLYAWVEPVYHQLNTLRLKDFIICALLAILGGLTVFWILHAKNNSHNDNQDEKPRWIPLVLLGLITVIGTSLPIVFVNRGVTFENYSKYSLSGMIGGVFILGGLLFRFVKPGLRNLVISFLIFSGIFTQLGVGKGLAFDWKGSKQLWWELSWRAPSLKPGTLLTARTATYGIAEGFNVWGPANLVFYPEEKNPIITAETLNIDFIRAVMMDKDSSRNFRTYLLDMETNNLLVLSKPSGVSCLHLIDGQAPDYSIYDSPDLMLIGKYSKLAQVDLTATPSAPPVDIFGAEPSHGWCYYYQKAALASQKGDHQEVVRLREEANAQGLKPDDAIELVPFILAYAETGNNDQLNKILPIFFNYPFHRVNYCANLIDHRYQIGETANQKLIDLSCMGENSDKEVKN